MRLPFIQIRSEAFDRAAELAALLEIDEAKALGHLAFLWRWMLSAPGDEAPTGVVPGTGAVAVLRFETGARWTGQRGVFLAALVDLGLVERLGEDSMRIRGAKLYSEAWEKQERSRERAKAYRDRARNEHERTRTVRARSRDVPAPNAHVHERAPGDVDVDVYLNTSAASVAEAPAAEPLKTEKPISVRKPSAAQDFFAWAQAEACKRQQDRVLDTPPDLARLNSELKKPLGEIGRKGLERAWLAYLVDPYASERSWPWGLFVSQWPKLHNQSAKLTQPTERESVRL